MRRLSFLLLVTACGSASPERPDAAAPDAAAPDAGAPDAGPISGGLERLDWRETRGAPLPASTVTLPAAVELWALPDDGFVTRSGCADDAGCTFSWHDDAGAISRERAHLVPSTATSVSPDGRRALLLALDEVGLCGDAEARPIVARGTIELLDLATGDASFELRLRTNPWSAPAFTPGGAWFFSAPIPEGACLPDGFDLRSTTAPFALAPGLSDDLALAEPLEERRWLVYRGEDAGFIDPAVAGSFDPVSLGDLPERIDDAGGWIHAYLGYADLAQEVVSIGPSGERRTTELRDEDWYAFGAWGRWVRVCRHIMVEGYRDCRVVDVLGEAAPVNFRVALGPDHPDDAVLLGRDGAMVFVGPLESGARAVQRIDLASGRREQLHAGDGQLRALGDGAAALLLHEGSAWLVEADREELLGDEVSLVVVSPAAPRRPRVRQDDLAVLALSTGEGQSTLRVLDLATRRLATLTDRLYLAPHLDFPFADGDCGQPLPVRRAGFPAEVIYQDARQLFFVEQPAAAGPAAIWIVPVDLSAPPRRLALLDGPPVACHAPLASPGGNRIGFAEDGVDGTSTRITIATP